MATITPTYADVYGPNDIYAKTVTWAAMANGDVGAAVTGNLVGFADVTVQAEGTFGAGGSVAWEGSNDATNFRALTDPQGTTIAITTAGIKQVTEAVLQRRPHVTAGDGTTSLTVTALLRRSLR